MKKIIICLTALMLGSAHANMVGLSTHPFTMNKSVITTEFSSYMSAGAGMGLNAKYFQRLNSKINVDAGAGFSDGQRSNRFFAGADYEFFPDFGRQPRISGKAFVETMNYDGIRMNTVAFAPTVSKGFSFWGNEAFPFVALPIGVGFNTDAGTYETMTSLSAGITGRLPIEGLENLVGNIETNVNVQNSYTALVLGISMPLQ